MELGRRGQQLMTLFYVSCKHQEYFERFVLNERKHFTKTLHILNPNQYVIGENESSLNNFVIVS